jgi:hypothetical protein
MFLLKVRDDDFVDDKGRPVTWAELVAMRDEATALVVPVLDLALGVIRALPEYKDNFP